MQGPDRADSYGMIHVAVLRAEYVAPLLEGRKKVELRLSLQRRTPFGEVAAGEWVYFKQTGGGFKVRARVERAEYIECLTPLGVTELRDRLEGAVLGGEAFWEGKREARYATILWLTAIEPANEGPDYSSTGQSPRQAWFVLPESAARSTSKKARRAG
jgi:ASC-1-like (ASCH) protein